LAYPFERIPWVLDQQARLLTFQAILTVCTHRSWIAYAVHIRTNHVHAVIGGEGKPERMLSDFKAYATRAFRSSTAVRKREYALSLERRRPERGY
jgi:hypothetical protein